MDVAYESDEIVARVHEDRLEPPGHTVLSPAAELENYGGQVAPRRLQNEVVVVVHEAVSVE
jgi:hypothetical protein